MAAYDPNGLIIEIPNFWKSQGVDVLKYEYLYDKIQLNDSVWAFSPQSVGSNC